MPKGKYRVYIGATGYKETWTETFVHAGSSDLDLGKIGLEPCGAFVLEVVDSDGEPVEPFEVTGNGLNLIRQVRDKQESGIYCYTYGNLPLGALTIEVSARGFETATRKLELEPAVPSEIRVVLEEKKK